ncbi:uncharacterized protein LOC120073672 [Benincasa hispida]|uniref:uncharacterized protein LOC120073672 n=1 Tax=Benincasa hispida TaxID=102211 RepID=UPI0019019E01|nr:uncharacterized protein LOC120073672 [Benincasa hispida]
MSILRTPIESDLWMRNVLSVLPVGGRREPIPMILFIRTCGTIDSSLSRLDGRISSLDNRVSNREENMTDMKGQFPAILSLLQSMCKGSTVNEKTTKSPIPSWDLDTNNATASNTLIPPIRPQNTTTSPILIPL